MLGIVLLIRRSRYYAPINGMPHLTYLGQVKKGGFALAIFPKSLLLSKNCFDPLKWHTHSLSLSSEKFSWISHTVHKSICKGYNYVGDGTQVWRLVPVGYVNSSYTPMINQNFLFTFICASLHDLSHPYLSSIATQQKCYCPFTASGIQWK